MLERFTEDARRATVLARDEALALHHDHVGPAHVLLALAQSGGPAAATLREAGVDADRVRQVLRASGGSVGGLDADALAALGIDLNRVRENAEAVFGPGVLDEPTPGRRGHIRFSDSAKQSLAVAVRHAFASGSKKLDGHAVLLGVLSVGDGTVARVLRELGVDAAALRRGAGEADAA